MKRIMDVAKTVNLVLFFAIQLLVYAAGAYWAWSQSDSLIIQLTLLLVVVGTLTITWAAFGHPGARRYLTGWRRALLELPWFGSAFVFLLLLGRPDWANGFAFWYGLNVTLRITWRQI
ncbi:MAG: YrdB family protein [Micropruina sp.]|nr:YrdB family protein [Micropruina sp.]